HGHARFHEGCPGGRELPALRRGHRRYGACGGPGMSTTTTSNSTAPAVPAGGAAEAAYSPRAVVEAFQRRLRSGELGQLPVILGLIVIAVVFQSLNSNFLTAQNLYFLTLQMVSV